MPLTEEVGLVVAGGRSRRMGRDKALLAWNESTLLDHAVARLRAICSDVRILSGAERRYLDRGLPVEIDAVPGAGPLGGIYTGLLAIGPGTGLFLGVVESLAGIWIGNQYREVTALVLFLVVLSFRPHGFFGRAYA